MPKFENDLTQGSVTKKLIVFALPFVLSNLIQSLYSVADMIIIGQFTNYACLNGVSNATQLTMLFTSAVIGLSVGGTVLIGQYMGSGNKKEIKTTIATVFTMLGLIAIALTAVSPFVGRPLLSLMKMDSASIPDGVTYFTTVMSGTLFVFAYNALAGVLRGMGDSKHPMIFVAIAAGTNVVLDLLLVAWLGMGAFGAALATVASQAFSVVLCIIYLKRNEFIFDFKPSSFRINHEKLKIVFRIGLPTMLNNVATSFSFVFLMSMANVINPSGGGAVGVVAKYNGFAILPAIGMSASISSMVAQNFGADNIPRVKKTFRTGMILALSFTAIIFALTQLFPEQILRLFNGDETYIALGKDYLRMFSLDYLIVPFQFCFNGLFIGTGHTSFALVSGICSSILFRIPFCYLLGVAFSFGMKGLGCGAPIASLAATCISLTFYLLGRWRKKTVNIKSEKAPAPVTSEA